MAKPKKQAPQERKEMHGVERLALRVSSMINHPVAQQQRWVILHQLETDGQAEWDEVMRVISESDELELTFNDDETVTLQWEASDEDQDRTVSSEDIASLESEEEEVAPF